MPLDLETLSDVIAMAVNDAVGPLKAKLDVAEAKVADLIALQETVTQLRERVVVAETKAALLQPAAPVDVSPIVERLTALEAKAATVTDTSALAHRLEAVEGLERKTADVSVEDIAALRDRLVALETKAAVLESRVAEPVALVERTDRQVAELSKDLGLVRERIAVAEVRQLVPGPAGRDGKDGKDGQDGVGWDDLSVSHDGERTFAIQMVKGDRVKDAGAFKVPSMIYRGVFREGTTYEPGDTVTYGGSMFHCRKTTVVRPDSRAVTDGAGGFTGPNGQDYWTLVVKRGENGKHGVLPPSESARPVVRVK